MCIPLNLCIKSLLKKETRHGSRITSDKFREGLRMVFREKYESLHLNFFNEMGHLDIFLCYEKFKGSTHVEHSVISILLESI